MKKRLFAALMAVCIMLSVFCSTASAAEATSFDSMLAILSGMASSDIDMEAWGHSGIGAFNYDYFNRMFSYTGDDDPNDIAYWETLGLKKILYDQDDADHIWAMYVPESYYEEENKNREYPVVFIWHGHGNPILFAEHYGFLEEAADREYIAVIPWAANDDEYLTETDRIYSIVKDNYRIDESRVYCTGFSKGGQTTLALALERSNIFAAATACGVASNAKFYENGEEFVLSGRGPLTQTDFDEAGSRVPVMIIAGDSDVYQAMPYNTEEKIWAINEWLGFEGIDHEQSLDNSLSLLENGEDVVERKIGLSFDSTKVVSLDSLYYIGEYYNKYNVNTFTVVAVENHLHSTSRGMAKLAFDYFEGFAKCRLTGRTVKVS